MELVIVNIHEDNEYSMKASHLPGALIEVMTKAGFPDTTKES